MKNKFNNGYYRFGDLYKKYSTLKSKSRKDFVEITNNKFITYKNVFKNDFIVDDLEFGNVFISQEENQNTTSYGDVIFTSSSETPVEIAMSSIVLTTKPLYVNSFCQAYKFIGPRNLVNFKYLGYYLRSQN
ncbi:MAG: hypothetical protein LBF97_05735 [Elusimicrobiota bacterium]|jgi:type I restriction enzyme S subunit|nr:hypothetical protein [Elusimicrobiota bacterium]